MTSLAQCFAARHLSGRAHPRFWRKSTKFCRAANFCPSHQTRPSHPSFLQRSLLEFYQFPWLSMVEDPWAWQDKLPWKWEQIAPKFFGQPLLRDQLSSFQPRSWSATGSMTGWTWALSISGRIGGNHDTCKGNSSISHERCSCNATRSIWVTCIRKTLLFACLLWDPVPDQ